MVIVLDHAFVVMAGVLLEELLLSVRASVTAYQGCKN